MLNIICVSSLVVGSGVSFSSLAPFLCSSLCFSLLLTSSLLILQANSDEVRKLVGADGSCKGENDRVLGFFYVGCASERVAGYKARRGAIGDKVVWRE